MEKLKGSCQLIRKPDHVVKIQKALKMSIFSVKLKTLIFKQSIIFTHVLFATVCPIINVLFSIDVVVVSLSVFSKVEFIFVNLSLLFHQQSILCPCVD